MMNLFAALLISSCVGTIIWLMLSAIRPLTQRGFSQTWHYYSSLIPVFFLLGGSEIMSPFISLISYAGAGTGTSLLFVSGNGGGNPAGLLPTVLPTGETSFASVWAGYAGWLEQHRGWILSFLVIWAAGVLTFVAIPIRQYRLFKRSILRDGRVCKDLHCPVTVIVSAKATTPMLIGLWRPVIVLPDTPLGENELSMILSHELVHFKRGDLLVKLLVFIANALHWFNPVVYMLNKQVSVFCELSCDEKVVQNMDAGGRRCYGETLLSMMEYGVVKRNVICTSNLCNPKRDMKRRLIHLMNKKKPKKTMLTLSLIAAIALVGTGGTAAYAAGSAIPSKNASSKQMEGRNVTVQNPDGTLASFDQDGNQIPGKPKESHPSKKLTGKELADRILKHIEKGLDVPQGYIDDLPQKDLDSINEAYGLKQAAFGVIFNFRIVEQFLESMILGCVYITNTR